MLLPAPGAEEGSEPLRLPASAITHRFSLYRALFDPHAPPGIPLSPSAWACPDAAALAALLPLQSGQTAEEHIVNGIYELYFTPTPSQRDTFRSVLMHRLSAVWGPPGSGKTHFSSGLLLALSTAHLRVRRPFRVLMTSSTKAAARVLLRKLADEKKRLQRASLPGNHVQLFSADDEWEPNDIDAAPAAAGLWEAQHCVVGATVWKAHKLYCANAHRTTARMQAPTHFAPKFDLILVDEASQLTACDAMMVVDLLNPFTGRLVVVGDDLQLPPLVQGAGYPESTDGAPSPAASLLSAVRGVLRAAGQEGVAHMDACVLLDNHRMAPHLAEFCSKPAGLYPADFRLCSIAGCPCRNKSRELRFNRGTEALQEQTPWLARALNPAAQLVVIRLPGVDDVQEAAAAASLLRATSSVWEGQHELCDSVFVVAPHHVQIARLRSTLALVADAKLAGLSISTVDTVQGREAEMVIVLYAQTDAEGIAAEAEFMYNLPRLNVALTRARQKMVLLLTRAVAAPDARASAASPAVDEGLTFLRRAASTARALGTYIRLRQTSPDDAATFEEDTGDDSDDEGMPAKPPLAWPAAVDALANCDSGDSDADDGAGGSRLPRADSEADADETQDDSGLGLRVTSQGLEELNLVRTRSPAAPAADAPAADVQPPAVTPAPKSVAFNRLFGIGGAAAPGDAPPAFSPVRELAAAANDGSPEWRRRHGHTGIPGRNASTDPPRPAGSESVECSPPLRAPHSAGDAAGRAPRQRSAAASRMHKPALNFDAAA